MATLKKPTRVSEVAEISKDAQMAAMEAQVAEAWREYCATTSHELKKTMVEHDKARQRHAELAARLKEMKDAAHSH